MDIREQIVKCSKDNFDSLYEDPCAENVAESILELPEINEALNLLELKRQGKLLMNNLTIYPNTKGGRKASKYRLAGRNDVIDWVNTELINQYISPDDIIYRKWVDKIQEWNGNE
jgi:hypothetical protein